ncbi:MAG TPA: NrfD/PsrC family molybdoenzyme membrane anchor subunit [Streptosporangiaceae bacterium]|nr:NrfD/PsrC family molybdoenzyme membrane anchor subunit [Streptosporangiaceae bacterium]
MSEVSQVPEAEFRSYYGRPVLKLPRWKEPHLPAYLFLGGLSGAAAVMGAAAAAAGRRPLRRAGRLTAAAAAAGGTGFLVAELGRPERFANMLRVAKPTSPMSMGAWLLAAHSSLAGAAAASEVTGVAPGLGAAAGAGSALTGPLLATYTGVLLANTAVPAWHEAYRQLPFLFAGSSMASAGAAGLAATALAPGRERVPAARLAVLGAAIDVAASVALERRAGLAGETYTRGGAGQMMRAARWLMPAGAAVALAAPRSRLAALAAAGLLAGGAVATRFGVFRAGPASVADPKYVVAAQRQGPAGG